MLAWNPSQTPKKILITLHLFSHKPGWLYVVLALPTQVWVPQTAGVRLRCLSPLWSVPGIWGTSPV